MRLSTFAVIALVAVILTGCAPANKTSQPGSPIPPLHAVAFTDQNHGWAGGDGVILTTSDGGKSWTKQYAGTDSVVALDFAASSSGWALTSTGALLRTTDGGRHWVLLSGTARLRLIDMVTPARPCSSAPTAV